MPDKNEIEKRKQITRALRQRARREFDSGLPMSREKFNALFDNLEKQLTGSACDNTLRLSIGILKSLHLNDIDTVTKWLEVNGGYCDCEVLANIEEKFHDDAIL